MLRDRELLGSELRDKIELYSELTGENGWNVPVARVADFISGFEMGKERFRKRGHWIGHREHCENLGVIPSGLGAYEWCSNCDCGIDVREWHRNHYNYCPDCGAYMREDE